MDDPHYPLPGNRYSSDILKTSSGVKTTNKHAFETTVVTNIVTTRAKSSSHRINIYSAEIKLDMGAYQSRVAGPRFSSTPPQIGVSKYRRTLCSARPASAPACWTPSATRTCCTGRGLTPRRGSATKRKGGPSDAQRGEPFSRHGRANVNVEFAREAINAVGASETVQHVVGNSPEGMHAHDDDIGRWTTVEAKLRALPRGVAAANTVRRERFGLAAKPA
jgi:hypothetical protein